MTKPSSEEIAERDLRRCGYRVYLPRYRKVLSPHGRDRASGCSMRALFPGMVFAQDWRGWPLQSIGGVIGLMPGMGRGTNAKLSDADVSLLMAKERGLEFDEVRRPQGSGGYMREDIKPGDTVEVEAHGVRVMGVLTELSKDGRAVVEAMLFGRTVPVSVDAEGLRLASGGGSAG